MKQRGRRSGASLVAVVPEPAHDRGCIPTFRRPSICQTRPPTSGGRSWRASCSTSRTISCCSNCCASKSTSAREPARRWLMPARSTIENAHGRLTPHPAVTIMKNAATLAARLLRELGLDDVMPDPGNRPRPLRSNGNEAPRRQQRMAGRITSAALAAYRRGDWSALHDALMLPPWPFRRST